MTNMNPGILLLLVLLFGSPAYSQNIVFSDLALKSFLLNELCIDTNNDGTPDSDADLNNDNEIQVSEAIGADNLTIGKFPDTYFIRSVTDVQSFANLKSLTLLFNDSIEKVAGLGLDSLSFLWIAASNSLKHIDISDLNGINNLRIEGIDSLDYLNLQNGSIPSGIFSLFYSENIKYACVDSIAAEYNEVAWRMLPGMLPSLNCITGTLSSTQEIERFSLFPNPTDGLVAIKTKNPIERVLVTGLTGKIHRAFTVPGKQVDLSELPNGIYFIEIRTTEKLEILKLVKN